MAGFNVSGHGCCTARIKKTCRVCCRVRFELDVDDKMTSHRVQDDQPQSLKCDTQPKLDDVQPC